MSQAASSHRPPCPSTAEPSLSQALHLHHRTQQLLMHPPSTESSNCPLNQGPWVPEPPHGAEFHSVIKHCMKTRKSFSSFTF